MPFKAKDAKRHTKKADTPKKQRQFRDIANSIMAKGGSEGSAIRQANGVLKKEHARRVKK